MIVSTVSTSLAVLGCQLEGLTRVGHHQMKVGGGGE